MKGIKECLNFMIDNPGVEIQSKCNPTVESPEGVVERIVSYSMHNMKNWTIEWKHGGIVVLTIFEEEEWEEVKTPFTFEEAYKECLESKIIDDIEFKTKCGLVMYKYYDGNVYINSEDFEESEHKDGEIGQERMDFVLNVEWFKK